MFEKSTFITHFETFKNSFDEILDEYKNEPEPDIAFEVYLYSNLFILKQQLYYTNVPTEHN